MRALSTTQTNNAEERDEKNFPRRQRPIHTPPVRHHWIPESYFAFMHQKTGVTGGYVLPATVLTALLSKEMWVMEHEFYTIPGKFENAHSVKFYEIYVKMIPKFTKFSYSSPHCLGWNCQSHEDQWHHSND